MSLVPPTQYRLPLFIALKYKQTVKPKWKHNAQVFKKKIRWIQIFNRFTKSEYNEFINF